MELQATFVKTDKLYNNLVDAVDQNALMSISYLYKVQMTNDMCFTLPKNCSCLGRTNRQSVLKNTNELFG